MLFRCKAIATRIFWAALVVAAVSLTGCGSSGQAAPTPTPWPTPVIVQQTTYTVQRGTVVDDIVLQGRVSPAVWDALFFKVDGKLTTLNVSEGDWVRQGDLLAELDTKVLNDQLSQARLSLEQIQNQAEQTDASRKYALERARLNLHLQELALDRLRRSLEHSEPLKKEQAAKELERARVNLQRAQAAYNAVAARPDVGATPQAAALQTATIEYELAEIKYKLATISDADIQVATQEVQVQLARLAVQELEERLQVASQNDVTKAQMQVEALERQIEERRLRAPYDGQVVAIGINVQGLTRGFAQRPKVGDNIPAYAALVVIARPEPLEITIEAGQKRVGELYIGQPVTITHAAWSTPFAAAITALPVQMSGSGMQRTGSQAIRIALPPTAPPMASGDPVSVYAQVSVKEDTLFLEPPAVRRFAERTFVVVQEGERQRRIDVTVGLQTDTQIEILSGLKEGDVVIGP